MGRAEGICHLIQQTPKLIRLENDLGTHGYDLAEQARGLGNPRPVHCRVVGL